VNILLIFSNKITLVDTGVKGSEDKIFDYIRQNNRDIADIETIILSHSHPDHVGSAATIKELTGCKVLAHKGEQQWIENIELQNQQRPVPGFFGLVDRSVKIDAFIADGQKMELEPALTLQFSHAPGHSKGSLNILFLEDKILFTADSVPLKNDIPNYDNYNDLVNSLSRIKNNRQYQTLLTSWTPPFSDKSQIFNLLTDGEEYIKHIDAVVKEYYVDNQIDTLEACRRTIEKLGLPSVWANPLVDMAFKSHLL
jgi:glyoxylase-like metal-dependent hydrolase (beta-lactamase superfamily II)